MNYEKNVGGFDKKMRLIAGTILVLLGAALVAYPATGIFFGVLVIVGGSSLLFNALTGFCTVNYLLGINTCKVDTEESEKTG